MKPERMQALVEGYLADRLSDEEKAELTAWLDRDVAHRAAFREAVELDYFLDAQLNASGSSDAEGLSSSTDSGSSRSPRFSRWHLLGMAALLLLSLTLGWFLFSGRGPSQELTDASGSVALLKAVDGDAVFSRNHDLATKPGSALGNGWLRLDQGAVELAFHRGATVEVVGPAVFGIDSEMRGFLESGEVNVHTPEEARDFVIGTAHMEVVDLGTRFHLRVDQNAKAEVTVIEGLVELHLGGGGTPRRIQTLPAGLHATISAAGEIVALEGSPIDPEFAQDSGLLAHWTLDAVEAGRTVRDRSGHARHARFRGPMEQAEINGKSGGAFDLRRHRSIGFSDQIPGLTKARSFTFAAWVKDAQNILFSFSDDSPRNRIQFERWGNQLIYGWQQEGGFDAVQGNVSGWESGRWHHVAVTFSGREVALYFDGRLLTSSAIGQRISSPILAPSDFSNLTHGYIGLLPSNHDQQPQRLNGQIDDIQFYGRALDEKAIRFLYEHPGEVFGTSETF